MSELDDLDEIEITPTRDGRSAKLIRSGRKQAAKLLAKAHSRPKLKQQLSAEASWNGRKHKSVKP